MKTLGIIIGMISGTILSSCFDGYKGLLAVIVVCLVITGVEIYKEGIKHEQK